MEFETKVTKWLNLVRLDERMYDWRYTVRLHMSVSARDGVAVVKGSALGVYCNYGL